jgi:hypothetical protein
VNWPSHAVSDTGALTLLTRHPGRMLRSSLLALVVVLAALPALASADVRAPSLASDPGWEGHNNAPTAPPCKNRKQAFGVAGTRIGGEIDRSITPASFSRPIQTRTLRTGFSASGRFQIEGPPFGGTLQLGWFNHASRGWRLPNSLLLRVIGPLGPKRTGTVWVSYGTAAGSGGGKLYTPHGVPFAVHVNTPYRWKLRYDPRGAKVSFSIGHEHAMRYALPSPHRRAGMVLDRFGLINQQGDGAPVVGYVDGLRLDGQAAPVSPSSPDWAGSGNNVTFTDCAIHGRNAFGWQPPGKADAAGEVGGLIWRADQSKPTAPAWYADRVGPLSFNDELCASGTVRIDISGADSNSLFGWFASGARGVPYPPGFIGIGIDPNTRAGTRMGAAYRGAAGPLGRPRHSRWAPVAPGDKVHTWTLHYVPSGAGGQLTLTVDGHARPTVNVPAATRSAPVTLDRFGMRSVDSGGQAMLVYWGALHYTASAGAGCAGVAA